MRICSLVDTRKIEWRQAMANDKVIILLEPGKWLDGYGGGNEWESTFFKNFAWKMLRKEAERRLINIKNTFPNARIDE
jgi:hypothetical protein